MAGRIKHMERSRRSYKRDASVFNNFHRHAFKVANAKATRMTLGQRIANAIKPAAQALKRTVEK